jgi:hypothetical protein
MTEPAHAWGLLIHVGPWKTGTKTVQSGLASMSAMLAAHQIVSPAGGKNPGAQHTFANAMRRICTGSRTSSGHVYNGTDELYASCWTAACLPTEEAAFRAALLEPSQHVILSSEAFANVNPACPRFVEVFRAFDFVRVVLMYRNAASYALSEHGQRIASGSALALRWQPFAFPNQTMQMSVEAACPDRLRYFEGCDSQLVRCLWAVVTKCSGSGRLGGRRNGSRCCCCPCRLLPARVSAAPCRRKTQLRSCTPRNVLAATTAAAGSTTGRPRVQLLAKAIKRE